MEMQNIIYQKIPKFKTQWLEINTTYSQVSAATGIKVSPAITKLPHS